MTAIAYSGPLSSAISKMKKLKQASAADDPYLAQVRNLVTGGKS